MLLYMIFEQINQEKEPADILREFAVKKLQQLFPEKNCNSIVDSFLIDLLSHHGLPSMLHRMEPEKQKEILTVEGRTLEESIESIVMDIPENLVEFYRKKLENQVKRDFDLL